MSNCSVSNIHIGSFKSVHPRYAFFKFFLLLQIIGKKLNNCDLNGFVRPIQFVLCYCLVASTSKVLSFRLSGAPGKGCWTAYPSSATEKCLKTEGEEAQVLVPFCDHKPLQFGICHHQVSKNYGYVFFCDLLFVIFKSILRIS